MPKISIVPYITKKLKTLMAINQDGPTATRAIAQGKYVVWNSDLYTADSDIASGDTLASSGNGKNLTAVTDGGLNDVRGAIPSVVNNLTSDSTTNALSAAQGKAINDNIDQSIIGNSPTDIGTSGVNLNSYTTIGYYACSRNDIAASLVNCPITTAFTLQVVRGINNTTVIQRLTKHNTSITYERILYSGAWTGWSCLSDQIANLIKVYTVNLDNTGSLAGGATKSVTKTISSFIDTGYSVVAVIPRYSGDDQFAFVSVNFDSTLIAATVRNVSSTADSGAPAVYVIAMKT